MFGARVLATFALATAVSAHGPRVAGSATAARMDTRILRPGARGNYTHVPDAVVEAMYGSPRASRLQEITSQRLWPKPVSVNQDAGSSWSQVSGAGEAAVGPDCPYIAHGPADSLQDCMTACASDGSCNVINWNPSIPDCVFRQCVSPSSPTLSPAPGYTVYGLQRTGFTLDANSFQFVAKGFTDDVLQSAMSRYKAITFIYGPNKSGGIGTPIPGIYITVTTADNVLRLGVDESYQLALPDSTGWAAITAPTVFGALRALETFSQLIQYNFTDGSYVTTFTNVTDYPRFPWRGVMIDTARHYLSVTAIQQMIDAMSYLKLNALHWHISDDQSWPLVVAQYPRLSATGAYSNVSHVYTASMVQQIVEYARLRGVRVIPEFDSPAHFNTLYHAYPQYCALAYDNNNNSFFCLVDPSKEETFAFLAGIWAEIVSLFPDAMVHIGGDEFWPGCWQQSPNVSAWMAQNGFDVQAAYWYYERRMVDIIRGLNRSILAWQDVAGFQLPHANYSDVTLEVWSGCYSGNWQDDVTSFTSQNMSVLVSGPYYITQQNGAPNTPHFTWEQMYMTDLWNFTGNTTAAQALVHGGELCIWGDASQADSANLMATASDYMIGVAEAWWSPQSATSGVQPDEGRAHDNRCRLLQRGLPMAPIYSFGTYCLYEYAVPLAPFENVTISAMGQY